MAITYDSPADGLTFYVTAITSTAGKSGEQNYVAAGWLVVFAAGFGLTASCTVRIRSHGLSIQKS